MNAVISYNHPILGHWIPQPSHFVFKTHKTKTLLGKSMLNLSRKENIHLMLICITQMKYELLSTILHISDFTKAIHRRFSSFYLPQIQAQTRCRGDTSMQEPHE